MGYLNSFYYPRSDLEIVECHTGNGLSIRQRKCDREHCGKSKRVYCGLSKLGVHSFHVA